MITIGFPSYGKSPVQHIARRVYMQAQKLSRNLLPESNIAILIFESIGVGELSN
jgi:hypothetical protein